MSKTFKAISEMFAGPGGILFLAALVIYLPGIWWGVTPAHIAAVAHPWGSDELAPLQSVTESWGIFFARQPHFNPQYPAFHNFMQALFVLPYIGFLWLTGAMSHPQPFYPFGFNDPVTALRVVTYLARSVSWLMGAGVVLAAYRTGLVMKDRLMGWICGLMALVLYPMFYYSRVSNVDMGALFWTALGLYVFAVCLRDGLTDRRAVCLALFAAFGAASKDASWAAFFMMGIVVAYWHLASAPAAKYRPLLIGLGTGLAAYLAASGAIFRPSRYMAHLHFISGSGFPQKYRVPITIEGFSRLSWDIGINVLDSLGTPVALCALAGLILCLLHERSRLVWVLPAVGVVLLVLFPARFVLIRYVLLIAYVLIFFAAVALRAAFDSPSLRRVAPVLLVTVAGWSFVRGCDLTSQMINDARYDAGELLGRHGKPGDRILHFTLAPNLPPLKAGLQTVAVPVKSQYQFKGTQDDPEFLVLVPFSLFPSEPEHEPNLSDQDYQALRAGTLGYQQIFRGQAKRLFSKRSIPWVNPLVQVFVRRDRLPLPGGD